MKNNTAIKSFFLQTTEMLVVQSPFKAVSTWSGIYYYAILSELSNVPVDSMNRYK